MSSTEFWYSVGDWFIASFAILRAGGNVVNWFFIIFITIALLAWMVMQAKYNAKEMKELGKLK